MHSPHLGHRAGSAPKTLATGRIDRGQIRVGDTVEMVGLTDPDQAVRSVVVTGVQMFRKALRHNR